MDRVCSPIPNFSEIAINLPGPIDIRWYALAYIVGLVLGWRYYLRLVSQLTLWSGDPKAAAPMSRDDVDEALFLATLGVVLGGRFGYVLFYMGETNPGWFQQNPLQAFQIWTGGMSFHGGLIGVALAFGWLSWRRNLPFLRMVDGAAAVTPIGLFFGRIANFINGELYGRPWDGPWAMVFPCDGVGLPRHPSQLYEALLEGLALFLILRVLTHRFHILRRPGLATGVFLLGYGLFRTFVENFRQPDAGLENLPFGLTMGMMLSGPMWVIGAWLVWRALRREPMGAAPAAAQ